MTSACLTAPIYMRLDYVEGADLHHLIARRRPTPGIALRIAEEIAAALAYLYQVSDDQKRPLGLVHRDVSPTNILLSRQGDVKLTDYGIAKATALAEVTRANVRKGKYAYMSPEQVDGKPLDARTDQFSLGVTLIEVLTGTRPFEGATPLETMERVREAAPPTLPDVDDALAHVIARCLQRDPIDRFSDAHALGDALRACRRNLRPAELGDVGRWVARLLDEET
ncbi:MAG: serine/threonine protein kinase [Deltaproteobacteria bacterium]|nr:serine/threonine protein kinase [Deltaproteobacteria bacterium]